MNILQIQNLTKTYTLDGIHDVQVLRGIDLTIDEGQIVTILGPSGVGKSTLLHLIGALDRPTSGKVIINSKDLFLLNETELAKFRNETIGFVFQFHHLLPEFSALENVMLPAMIAGKKPQEIRDRSIALLAEVGLEKRIEHRPNELSGGEQQRVAVARALINSPKLVLADEPSGNLDVHTAKALHQLLWKISRDHKQTLIIVTHNQDLSAHADRHIELYDGRILADQKIMRQ